MSQHDEPLSSVDPIVSDAYRAVATESVPPRLDDMVLRKAAEATQSTSGFGRYIYAVRRPLAFAATLVLALSLVLQFDYLITGNVPNQNLGVSQLDRETTSAGNISALIDTGPKRVQEQTKQGERLMSRGLADQSPPETSSESDTKNTDSARSCASEQTATAERWWACITDLKTHGRYDAAAAERELLTNTYPDFSPAE